MSEKEIIIDKLKQRGYRITKQRKILLDIILEERCSSCKEIYYKASQQDEDIGAATVYRMINTLEEIGAIDRGNMYKIDWKKERKDDLEYFVELEDDSTIELSAKRWQEIVKAGLMACGYKTDAEIRNISVRGMEQEAV